MICARGSCCTDRFLDSSQLLPTLPTTPSSFLDTFRQISLPVLSPFSAPLHGVEGQQPGPPASSTPDQQILSDRPRAGYKNKSPPPDSLEIDADRASLRAFFATRSHVVRFYGLKPSFPAILSTLFSARCADEPRAVHPVSMWINCKGTRTVPDGSETQEVLALFSSHEEAAAALSLSHPYITVSPALYSDLEPLSNLRLFSHESQVPLRCGISTRQFPDLLDIHLASSFDFGDSPCFNPLMREREPPRPTPAGVSTPYTISTNPPDPKTGFREGDWRCTVGNCAAHNFSRNLSCVGCGRVRNDHPRSVAINLSSFAESPMSCVSPRFAAASSGCGPYADFRNLLPLASQRSRTASLPGSVPPRATPPQQPPMVGSRTTSPYPLLTPSGRALSVGGRVQNVSHDPLAPCIMYWPDNEPLPEQGQIRPLGSAVISFPPIINTGNKGAAEKQPGDWICQKCHYLNWRRRKVCQTCFPYAEGNGDSISAAVQAERIALLENVLVNQVERAGQQDKWQSLDRSHTALPRMDLHTRYPSAPLATPSPLGPASGYRRVSLGQDTQPSPIYQTDGETRLAPSPLPPFPPTPAAPTTPLLPSFLQDIMKLPSLSPSTSTSSAELSTEDYDDPGMRPYSRSRGYAADQVLNASTSSFALSGSSIWKLDGEETKTLSTASSSSASTELRDLERGMSALFVNSR